MPSAGAAQPSANWGNAIANIGAVAQIGGSLIATIGAYAGALAARGGLRAGALTDEHRAALDELNASQARLAAQSVLAEGQRTRGRYSMAAAQQQSATRVNQTSRGVLNSGTSARVRASEKYAQQVDELTIDSNTLRQSQELKRQALSLRSSAEMRRVSAANQRRMSSTINPGLAAATQALQGMAASAGSFTARFR